MLYMSEEKDEVYAFVLEMDRKLINVGDVIYSPNGRKGVIEEITNVKQMSYGGIQIKGKASLK
jgi:hypothetical protein